MKIAIISHKTSNLLNSRGQLIADLVKKGHTVIAIGNEDINKEKIQKLGAIYRNVTFDRTTTSILKNYKYFKKLKAVLAEENADTVLTYTIKPIIFGSIAAKMNKIENIYALIAGMGYNYSINTPKIKAIRFFCNIGYKLAFKFNKKVIFQNKEDMKELIDKKYIKKEQAELVDGSGVNMNIFKKKENVIGKQFIFLMISRMLNVKGVIEYCQAAEYIKSKYPNTRFIHLGEFDNTYRGVKKEFISKYKDKVVEFKGRVKNVAEYIEKSNVVVLPSYLREGIPRTLQEALAVGRPIITTNVRGCRETVLEGENGYLVEPRNVEDLIKAMEKILNKSENEIRKMSEKSYEIALNRFELSKINKKMIKIMENS